jgi:magnesium transporter
MPKAAQQTHAFSYDRSKRRVVEREAERPNRPTDKDGLYWLAINDPKDTDYRLLKEEFNVSDLYIREIKNDAALPRIRTNDENTLITWYCLTDGSADETTRFSCVLGRGYLITLQQGKAPAIDAVAASITERPEIMGAGLGTLLFEILDGAADQYFLALDKLSDTVDLLEDKMFEDPGPDDIKNLFVLKRQLLDFRRIIAPSREVVNSLLRRNPDYFEAEARPRLEDLYDHLVRVIDLVETQRDVTGGAMQIYQATIANNMNAVMKQLTIIATIMMPLTLISGIFGMNVTFPGREHELAFWILIGGMLLIGAIMLVWFKRRRWV